MTLGKALVAEGLLTEQQLETAAQYQVSIGGKLRDIVLKLGFVSESDLNRFFGRHEHMRTVELTGRKVDEELLSRIPREVIEKHEVLPFKHSANTVLLVMSEPADYEAIEEIQFLTNSKIETALAPRSQIRELITRFYRDRDGHHVPSAEELLLGRVADPNVAAFIRALLKKGVVTVEEWSRESKGLSE